MSHPDNVLLFTLLVSSIVDDASEALLQQSCPGMRSSLQQERGYKEGVRFCSGVLSECCLYSLIVSRSLRLSVRVLSFVKCVYYWF